MYCVNITIRPTRKINALTGVLFAIERAQPKTNMHVILLVTFVDRPNNGDDVSNEKLSTR